MARARLSPGADVSRTSPQARWSLLLLLWIPLSPLVGFVLAGFVVSDSWPLWQVVPLALVLATPFIIGAYFGYSAVRRGDRTGWLGLTLHATMTVVAIVVPISESMAA